MSNDEVVAAVALLCRRARAAARATSRSPGASFFLSPCLTTTVAAIFSTGHAASSHGGARIRVPQRWSGEVNSGLGSSMRARRRRAGCGSMGRRNGEEMSKLAPRWHRQVGPAVSFTVKTRSTAKSVRGSTTDRKTGGNLNFFLKNVVFLEMCLKCGGFE